MAYKIKVSKRFRAKALKIYTWLAEEWNFSVADEFYEKVEQKLHLLQTQPQVGRPSGKKPEIRRTTITKHTILYYRVRKNNVDIVNLFNTLQNPKTNPYD